MSDSATSGPRSEKEIFFEALEKPTPQERAAFLDGACGTNPLQRARVDALLADHFQQDSFMKEPAAEPLPPTVPAPPPAEAPAQMLGRYKLLEKIGEGGFGEVWMAEQREPVKRRVALKIIKLGMDSRQIVARFEAERQALAMMDHPNIAKIFDAGTTGENAEVRMQNAEVRERLAPQPKPGLLHSAFNLLPSGSGRPYFVMELVRGIKITEYCDQNQLPTQERLRLFILVCQAIQHAHQKGIIHRDIKPSNILVTLHDGVPVPKVIDFGIAKATQGELTDKTVFTQFQQFIGTPAYISPEQAEMSGLDIDTRADIYSLGVLLYELLVGQTPFDAKEMMQGGLDALRQIIREREPLRPSTKLNTLPGDARTTAGKRRQTEVGKLVHQLQGDLDWIVMKCLEKDRTRRYDTANGLAMDIQRHLTNEAVLARPPSAAYRFQKLVRRHKLAFAAAGAVTLTLIAGLSLSTWAFLRERKAHASEAAQRQTAVAEQRKAEAAQASESVQRKLADMQLAVQAWEEGDLQRANDLIDASRPAPGQPAGFEWRYLRKLCQDQSIEPFRSQNHQYRSAQFFDRDLILLNDEKALTLHDLSGRKKQLLIEDQDGIRRPTFCSGNTNLLATVTDDGRIKVWDIAATRVLVELEGHPGSSIKSIAFSTDGRWLASASGDKSIKLWDVGSRNPKPGRNVYRYSVAARAVNFSPDGRQLFSSGNEAMIRAWDVATGKEAPVPFEGHTGWGGRMANSPDGLRMASSNGDSTVIVWNVISRKLEWRLVGHIAGATALAFSKDGRTLASGSTDHTIRLWDMKTGQQLSLLRGHGAAVGWLSFSPDGQTLVSRSDDGLVKLWHATSDFEGNTLIGSPEWRQDVALSPDGRRMASVAIDSFAVNLWNLPSRNLTLLTGHSNTVMCAAFSPDGRILATGSHDQTVRLWDMSDDKTVATLTNGFPVGSLAFSPDGRTLIVGGSSWSFLAGDQGGLQFWDVPLQEATGSLPVPASDVVELALSASGSMLATGHKDGGVGLWNAQTRRLLHRFESQFGSRAISLAFSPTEPLLAASDVDGNIVLYNTTTMKVLSPPLKAHTMRVMSLAFSPDGRTLASAGEGGGLKLWNVATRQLALTLKGHAGAVTGVAFSRDGNLLASCGADATVRLWPAATVEKADPSTKTKKENQ